MAKTPSNHNKAWSGSEVSKLRQLAHENTPTRVIGLKLGRTAEAVASKASEANISLKPDESVAIQPPEVGLTRFGRIPSGQR